MPLKALNLPDPSSLTIPDGPNGMPLMEGSEELTRVSEQSDTLCKLTCALQDELDAIEACMFHWLADK